jgi:hypothetical protein
MEVIMYDFYFESSYTKEGVDEKTGKHLGARITNVTIKNEFSGNIFVTGKAVQYAKDLDDKGIGRVMAVMHALEGVWSDINELTKKGFEVCLWQEFFLYGLNSRQIQGMENNSKSFLNDYYNKLAKF